MPLCPVCAGAPRPHILLTLPRSTKHRLLSLPWRPWEKDHRWRQCANCSLWWESIRYPFRTELQYRHGCRRGFASRAAWDPAEAKIARTLTGQVQPWRDVLDGVVQTVEPANGDMLLEVGCGSGDILDYAKTLGYWRKIVGTELGPDYVAFTRSRGHDVRQADIAAGVIPDLEGRCQLVVVNEVMEHVRSPVAFLASVKRHLAEDGIAFVSFAHVHGPTKIETGEWHYWTEAAISVVAFLAGLSIVKMHQGPYRYDVYLRDMAVRP